MFSLGVKINLQQKIIIKSLFVSGKNRPLFTLSPLNYITTYFVFKKKSMFLSLVTATVKRDRKKWNCKAWTKTATKCWGNNYRFLPDWCWSICNWLHLPRLFGMLEESMESPKNGALSVDSSISSWLMLIFNFLMALIISLL